MLGTGISALYFNPHLNPMLHLQGHYLLSITCTCGIQLSYVIILQKDTRNSVKSELTWKPEGEYYLCH